MNKQVEAIRQEIERLYDGEAPKHDQQCDFNDGYFTGIDAVSKFIDSMPNDSPGAPKIVSEDLEEAAKDAVCMAFGGDPAYYGNKAELSVNEYMRLFIVGAEWRKKQDEKEQADLFTIVALDAAQRAKEELMKEAIHYVVQDDLDSQGRSYNIPFIRIGITALKPKGIGVGDKVKIIIIKDKED